MLGPRFDQAMAYARVVHADQVRKGSSVPYMAHLLGVASLVLEDGGDEDEAIAALLHDAVEDRGGRPRLNDIRQRFGTRVATIVEGCSDAISEDGEPKGDWWGRKCGHLEHLAETDGDLREPLLRVSMADKLSNLRATVRDAGRGGERFWTVFRHGAASQLWYYGRMIALFHERLPESSMLPELDTLLVQLAELVPDADRELAARYRAERCPPVG
ncbi:MAG TPA: HD domain-containing protein [Gaiellales bacterium]|jgi:(p)ppGpp synthase/HD superfamily hydrolase